MPPALKTALHCATWPLAVGVGSYLYWLSARPGGPYYWGMITIGLSFPVNVFGFMCLASFHNSNKKNPDVLSDWRAASRWIVLLLVSNYPIALFCTVHAYFVAIEGVRRG